MKTKKIVEELFKHLPNTAFGAFLGTIFVTVFVLFGPEKQINEGLFDLCHMSHVFFSALATAGFYKIKNVRADWVKVIFIGIIGSIVIGTLSDCLIPALGVQLLGIGPVEVHAGIIHHTFSILALATAGSLVAYFVPCIKFPHTIHVFISTAASALHMVLNVGLIDVNFIGGITIILFVAVWFPCCLSDIVFPTICSSEGNCKEEKKND